MAKVRAWESRRRQKAPATLFTIETKLWKKHRPLSNSTQSGRSDHEKDETHVLYPLLEGIKAETVLFVGKRCDEKKETSQQVRFYPLTSMPGKI